MKAFEKIFTNSFFSTKPILLYIVKWLILSLIVGGLVGMASAFFLWSLHEVTDLRESNLWLIAFLPLGGLLIGLTYHYLGQDVVKGNNQLLEEIENPQKQIPLKMAPLVLFGTLVTHLFGGSAGREGTAVQMGGSIADFFTKVFNLSNHDRRILIIAGISAGFASVFGTPLAAAIFALEVMLLDKIRVQAVFPSFAIAFVANYTCILFPIAHTHYQIPEVPAITFELGMWTALSGVLFGLAAMLFAKSTRFFTTVFSKISYSPLRPFVGGIVLAIVVWLLGTTKYIGLGVPTIVESFSVEMPQYAFLLKIMLTAFTLGAGFKGGEVTPLFFIGATLGNILIWFVPMPIALLSGIGFVGVFAGATNTPIACTLMGIELFGIESLPYLLISCVVAYFFSGKKGIYSSQIIGRPKQYVYKKLGLI